MLSGALDYDLVPHSLRNNKFTVKLIERLPVPFLLATELHRRNTEFSSVA